MNTEKIMEDIQSVQDNIREIKSTWGNTIMTLDNIKSGLKADVQKKTMESFQRGYDDGYEAGCATAFKPVSDAEYQRGLDDAMSAFKKLYSCGWERDWKAMGFEFDEGEWSRSFEFIIGHYTAAEIVEKVKAYEDKKIHVGDEVFAVGTRTAYLVTSLDGLVGGISKSGKVHLQPEEELTKTRKHYDSIDEYMKGEGNA